MSTTQLIESDEAAQSGDLTSLLQRLANHLSKRGTKPTRAQTRVAAYYRSIGKPMPRDWRHVAKRYLAIEEVRFGHRLQVQWSLDPRTDAARLPPLLLQPLVENAVKHGVEPSSTGAQIRISKIGRAHV